MLKKDANGEKPKLKTLTIEDSAYKTTFTDKFENRVKWEKPDERKIYSILPGTLIKLNIAKGDKVKAGQQLLIFESMKMMNIMKASQSGVIKEILIKPGETFPKNQLLLEFE